MIREESVVEMLDLFSGLLRGGFYRRFGTETVLGEGAMLHFLCEQGSATAGEIASFLCVGSGRVANLLKATEKKGFIVRQKDREDARKLCVSLTDEGRKTCDRNTAEIKEKIRRIARGLGEEDFLDLLRLIRKLSDISGGSDV